MTLRSVDDSTAKNSVYLMDGEVIDAPYVSFCDGGVKIYPNYPNIIGYTWVPNMNLYKVVTR
jgi:hypothetical protein